ncbi:MAG TPA: metalloregulator ArsR/SmtB family transcription factor [Bryobacteraceae bacterium]|jgi:ArsR family transcriptional regulator|nr:metalloregulator ArsR/SmtB family transcription factor [Bryobacteraceae bacterium]
MKPKQIAKIAKALSDETRLDIFSAIAKADEVNCGDICSLQSVGGPSVSHHLRILSEAGLVDSRRQGQFIYYHAVPETLTDFTQQLALITTKGRR